MNKSTRGFVVLDADAKTRFAAGLGLDPILNETLQEIWKNRFQTRLPKLFTIKHLDDPLSVLVFFEQNAVCFLIQQHEKGDPLVEFVATVDFASDIFRHFITNPYEAMTVVDAQGLVRYISPVHEKFFGLSRGAAIGKPVSEVIENTRLDVVLRTGKSEVGQTQEMRGTTRVVNRTPIFGQKKQVLGAIGQVMFESPDALQKMSSEISRLRQEIGFYRRELSSLQRQSRSLDSIIGTSDAITQLKQQILKVAHLDVSVLLLGESGVGKDLVAHAIHILSPRASNPVVVINAAALPASLVESELFGYEAGAFTGADRKGRRGKFEQADQGTLFLDEIGDMPIEIQVKLLRTLQDGTFQRVGSDNLLRSDFRLISATHRDFNAMLADGSFRLDLFYRISAVTIRIPALRERQDDIPLLADTFLKNFAERHGEPVKSLEPEAITYLQSLSWPGNVRQLQHAIERAAIFSHTNRLSIDDFVAENAGSADRDMDAPIRNKPKDPRFTDSQSMQAAREHVENNLITETLLQLGGNKKRTAETLGISRSYLYKRLAEIAKEKSSER